MKTNSRHLLAALSVGVLITAGVAYAQESFDRYSEAEANIVKAQALLNAITPATNPERKQHDKALNDLANALDHIECARLRLDDPHAACP
jgi:hypothetical protein